MPIIHIDMFEGRSPEQRSDLAAGVTAAVVRALDCDPSSVRILIQEYPKSHWAVGGVLVADGNG